MVWERRSGEDRRSKRYRFSAEATLRPLDTGLALPGVLLDLSAKGGLLRLSEPSDLEIGMSVDFAVNSKSIDFRAVGSVRHYTRELRLIGISFVSLNRRGETDLLQLIDELEAAHKSNRAPR